MFLSRAGLLQKGPGRGRPAASRRLNSMMRPMSGMIATSAARLRRMIAFHPWKLEWVAVAELRLAFAAGHKGRIVRAQMAARILATKYFASRVFRTRNGV